MNARFKDRGVTFADNQFSDLSKKEKKAYRGLGSRGRKLDAEDQVPRPGAGEGRMLNIDTPIDWFAAGKVGPVKNQY